MKEANRRAVQVCTFKHYDAWHMTFNLDGSSYPCICNMIYEKYIAQQDTNLNTDKYLYKVQIAVTSCKQTSYRVQNLNSVHSYYSKKKKINIYWRQPSPAIICIIYYRAAPNPKVACRKVF